MSTVKTPQLVVAAVAALALLGGGFAAGMAVGRSAAVAAASASPSGAARAGLGPGAGGRGALGGAGQAITTGRVLSVNDGSITIEVRQPGAQGASPSVTTQIVLVGATTRIVRSTEVEMKASELKANDQIQIVGATDASGSLSANAIVVGGNALQQLLGGGRGASPSASPRR